MLWHRLPVVCSLPAVGAIPSSWPHYMGILGHTGHERANRAIREADLLLVLGARLDVRQTGTLTDAWANGKQVVIVDYDQGELDNRRVKGTKLYHQSVKEWLNEHAGNSRSN